MATSSRQVHAMMAHLHGTRGRTFVFSNLDPNNMLDGGAVFFFMIHKSRRVKRRLEVTNTLSYALAGRVIMIQESHWPTWVCT